MNQFYKEHKASIFTFILTVVLLVSSIVFSALYNWIGLWKLIGTLFFILVVVGLNTIIVGYITKDKYSMKMQSYINLLKNYISETKTNTWLYSEEEIAEYERNVDCGSIILLSPDLKNDSGDSKYVEMVKEVIQKGIKYIYIVPENPLIKSRIDDLRKIFAKKLQQLKIIVIPQGDFNSLTTTTVVIYLQTTVTEKKVFIELPVFDGSYWWAATSKEQGDIFLGKMYDLLTKNKQKIT